MRRNRLLRATLLFLLFAFFGWSDFWGVHALKLSGAPQRGGGVTNTLSSDPLGSTNAHTRPLGIDERLWNAIVNNHRSLVADNGPISFYAQIIDQENKPVEGAELTVLVESYHEDIDLSRDLRDNRKKEYVRLYSDRAGRISLVGKRGCVLRIESLVKAGYLWSSKIFISYDYAPAHIPKAPEYADPARGALFSMWRRGEAQALIPLSHIIWLEAKPTNVYVNLITGPTTNLADADLIFSKTMLAPNDPQRPYDRRIEIRGASGAGLLQTNVAYPYKAPEAGYTLAYSEDRLISVRSTPPPPDWTKVFYVRGRAGRVFAGLEIEYVGNLERFKMSGYINPAGSPNLEPDESKLITDYDTIRKLDMETRAKN